MPPTKNQTTPLPWPGSSFFIFPFSGGLALSDNLTGALHFRFQVILSLCFSLFCFSRLFSRAAAFIFLPRHRLVLTQRTDPPLQALPTSLDSFSSSLSFCFFLLSLNFVFFCSFFLLLYFFNFAASAFSPSSRPHSLVLIRLLRCSRLRPTTFAIRPLLAHVAPFSTLFHPPSSKCTFGEDDSATPQINFPRTACAPP